MNATGIHEIERIVRDAQSAGKEIDLSGIGYGEPHWDNGTFGTEPIDYYFFLAGLIRSQKMSRVLEIGTHMAGSTRSMLRGMDNPNGLLVTIDITDKATPYLEGLDRVRYIVADAESEKAIEQVVAAFGQEPIDMLYIDGMHMMGPTLRQFALYTMLLRPRIAVFDDINLSEYMESFWRVIKRTYPDRCADITDIDPRTRLKSAGMGIVIL